MRTPPITLHSMCLWLRPKRYLRVFRPLACLHERDERHKMRFCFWSIPRCRCYSVATIAQDYPRAYLTLAKFDAGPPCTRDEEGKLYVSCAHKISRHVLIPRGSRQALKQTSTKLSSMSSTIPFPPFTFPTLIDTLLLCTSLHLYSALNPPLSLCALSLRLIYHTHPPTTPPQWPNPSASPNSPSSSSS